MSVLPSMHRNALTSSQEPSCGKPSREDSPDPSIQDRRSTTVIQGDVL